MIATWLHWPNTSQYHKVAAISLTPHSCTTQGKISKLNLRSGAETEMKFAILLKAFYYGISRICVSHLGRYYVKLELKRETCWNKQSDRTLLNTVLCTAGLTHLYLYVKTSIKLLGHRFFFSFDIFSRMLDLCPVCREYEKMIRSRTIILELHKTNHWNIQCLSFSSATRARSFTVKIQLPEWK